MRMVVRLVRSVWRGVLAVPVIVLVPTLSAQVTAIVGATVIDGNGGAPLVDATLVIDGKRIKALGRRSSVAAPPGATVVDAKGKFIVPGLIDVNNHVTGTSFHKELFPMILFGEPDAIIKYG